MCHAPTCSPPATPPPDAQRRGGVRADASGWQRPRRTASHRHASGPAGGWWAGEVCVLSQAIPSLPSSPPHQHAHPPVPPPAHVQEYSLAEAQHVSAPPGSAGCRVLAAAPSLVAHLAPPAQALTRTCSPKPTTGLPAHAAQPRLERRRPQAAASASTSSSSAPCSCSAPAGSRRSASCVSRRASSATAGGAAQASCPAPACCRRAGVSGRSGGSGASGASGRPLSQAYCRVGGGRGD